MDDLISRQAALDAMETWDKFGCDPDGKLVRYDDDKHYIPYVHYEDMVHAIKHLPSAQPEMNLDEWCTDCKEYDKKRHCCPRFNRVIRTALQDAQPEIIYCKDCAKHEYCRTSTVWAIPPKDDWFCADAERREE